MNHLLAWTLLAPALVAVAAGCGDQTANPIEGSGGSTSSSSGGGGPGGSGGATSSSTGGGTPGACAPGCGHDQVCVDGACHALAARDVGNVEGCTIVLDDTHVYWAGAEVRIVPKAAGPAVSFGAWVGQPSGLAVDDTYLYFSSNGGLVRGKKDGKNGFVPFAGDGMGAPKFTVWDATAGTLYFNEDVTETEGPSIYVTTTQPGMTPALFANNGYGIGNLTLDATDVYFWGAGGIVRKDKTTHKQHDVYVPGTGLDGTPSNATGLVVDGSSLYFSYAPTVGVGGSVLRVDKTGGTKPERLVDTSLGASGVFAIDASDIYFMTVSSVMKVSKSGGTPVVVAELDPPSPFATCMAADDKYVYWVDGSTLKQYTK
jgi:hypothetical protein